MKKISIYADTSVIGGCCDPEFKFWSCLPLSHFQSGMYSLILSILTDAEIQKALNEVKKYYAQFRKCAEHILDLSLEAIELADSYLKHKIIPANYRDDARHIAIATIAGADLLVSWNFQHIVHFEKIQKFNTVNMESGYTPISIFSQWEVIQYGNKNK